MKPGNLRGLRRREYSRNYHRTKLFERIGRIPREHLKGVSHQLAVQPDVHTSTDAVQTLLLGQKDDGAKFQLASCTKSAGTIFARGRP